MYWSIFSALSIQLTLRWVFTPLSGFATKSTVATTSSASKSEPSWNFTPWRSLNSIVLSSTHFQSVARLPLYSFVSGSRYRRPSQTARCITTPSRDELK